MTKELVDFIPDDLGKGSIVGFRPDGEEISVREVKVTLDGVEDSFVVVDGACSSAHYTNAEVDQIGGGSRNIGLSRLVKNALFDDPVLAGRMKPFYDELKPGQLQINIS